jgi:hypothetical protein
MDASSPNRPPEATTAPLAIRPVLLVAALGAIGLLLLASRYGFHRDELYLIVAGRHPAWGYVDQPPLTPILAAIQVAVLGVSPTAVRILPILAYVGVVITGAATAREMGGARSSQIVAALVVATGAGALGASHTHGTTIFDLLAWAVVAWLVARILGGGDQRWWLAAGIAGGLGLLNKNLIVILAIGLLAGLVLDRRWAVLRSPWLWAGAAIAFLLWLPNLLWQATNGWPQLEMAAAIADRDGLENRILLLPLLALIAGLATVPVLLAGLAWLLRGSDGRPWRPIATAFLVGLALVFLSGGKAYYAMGLVPALVAAGAVVAGPWVLRTRTRIAAFAVALVANVLLGALLVLPVLPPEILATSPVMDIYPDSGEQVGWETLVAEVERVADSLPPDERARAVVFTMNYGEAGAVELLGNDLPPVYSGHNSYWDWGPPPDLDGPIIVLGFWDQSWMAPFCRDSRLVGRIDNGYDLENEEQGSPIWLCTERRGTWDEVWASLRHLS